MEFYEADATLINYFTPEMTLVRECVVDARGVTRDVFLGFWESAKYLMAVIHLSLLSTLRWI